MAVNKIDESLPTQQTNSSSWLASFRMSAITQMLRIVGSSSRDRLQDIPLRTKSEGDVLLQIEVDKIGKSYRTKLYNRRNKLQGELKKELDAILKEEDAEEGLSKLTFLLEGKNKDNKIKHLEDMMKEMDTWDKSPSKPKPEPFMIRARCQWYLARMLEDNRTYRLHLEKILERFQMENEMISLDPRNERVQLYAPLHYAAISVNIQLVEWLLGRPTIEVNIRDSKGKTALFLLCEQHAKCTEPGELKDIQRCITLLLEHGADFNICSTEPKLPFGLLVRNTCEGNEAFAEDCIKKFNRTVVYNTESVVRFCKLELSVHVTVELLEIYMRFKEDREFSRYFEKFSINQSNLGKVIKLLLHAAAEMNLEQYAKKIIDGHGSNIFQRDEAKGLLRKACENGSADMLKLLLERIDDQELLNHESLLNLTLNKAVGTKKGDKRDRILQCAELLAKDRRIRLVATDSKGRHAVHLTLKNGFTDVAQSLLQHRDIFLGKVNNESLLNLGTYEFWKEYFDWCVKVSGESKDVKRKDIQLKLNGLSPYAFGKALLDDGTPEGRKQQYTCRLKAEVEFSTTNQNKTPMVTDMDVTKEMAKSKNLEELLLHPTNFTYVMVKWLRVAHLCYLNFFCTLAIALCFTWYTFAQCNDGGPSYELTIGIRCGAVYLIIKKIIQLFFTPWNYLWSWQNILDIATISLMVYVLSTGCNSIVSSVVMLAFALRLTNLLGLMLGNIININLVVILQSLLPCLLKDSSVLSYFKKSWKNSTIDNVNSVLNNSTENDTSIKNAWPLHIVNGTFNNSTQNETANYEIFGNNSTEILHKFTWLVDAVNNFGGTHMLVILVIFVIFFTVQNLTSSELTSIANKAIVLHRYARGLHNPFAKFLLRHFPCLERQFAFFQNHSCDILIKQAESNKVLVQRWIGSGKKARKNAKSKFFQNGVVPKLPGGLFGDTFYLTLGGAVLEEAQRIVGETVKMNGTNAAGERLKSD